MFHLPAYLAFARWVAGRRVVVFDPSGPAGPRLLRDAGASLVLVVGDEVESEAGIQARPLDGPELPLRDRSVDAVLVIERFRDLDAAARRVLLEEAARVLRDDGVFAAWAPQPESRLFGHAQPDHAMDFYALEESVSTAFSWVRMLAQMPWQGFSLAPLPDDEELSAEPPAIRLDERLLGPVEGASHYLALGSSARPPSALIEACTMVPLPDAQIFDRVASDEVLDELETLREELSVRSARSVAAQNRTRELEGQLESLRARVDDRAHEAQGELETALQRARARADEAERAEKKLRTELEGLEAQRGRLVEELDDARSENQATKKALQEAQAQLERERDALGAKEKSERNDLVILTRTVNDQEQALARVTEQLRGAREELEHGQLRERELRGKLEGLEGERNELRRQLDVRMAEGEGARKLAARVEAELEVLRNRFGEQSDRLANKIEEASRLSGEVEMLRSRLAEQEASLQQTRSRAEALSASAAEGEQKGRMLAELAADRERLREELGARSRQIESLEEKLWEGRESLQREKLENVRLSGEVERLRELLSRGRDMEKQRAGELETLGGELRALELERVEIKALLRAREERLSQLLTEADALAGRSEDAGVLRGKLEAQRGELEALRAKLEKAEHLQRKSREEAEARASALTKLKEHARQVERRAEERGDLAARLQTELDMRGLEIQQIKEALGRATSEGTTTREAHARASEELAQREVELDRARHRESELSRRLFELESALDNVQLGADEHSAAVLDLRLELEAETSLDEVKAKAPRASLPPGEATHQQLRAQLAAAHAELERLRSGGDPAASSAAPAASRKQMRRLQLEIEVRASEQERMLLELDAAEQKIWEMTDASDRNAARFAASLAQLEKQKERVDQLLDELEVTRSLLAAEQARTLEQERLLASERAKLARAGLGSEGFPSSEDEMTDVVFSDLGANPKLVKLDPAGSDRAPPPEASGAFALDADLERLVGKESTAPRPSHPPEPGAPRQVDDRGATSNHRGTPVPDPKRTRVLVEEVAEDEWVDED